MFTISVVTTLLFPVVLYVVFQSSFVQTFLIQKITTYLSKNLKTKVEIKRVDISFFNKLILEGVYIRDLDKDTLLYINKLKSDFNDIDFKKRVLSFDDLELNQIVFRLKTDSLENTNLQFLIDALSSKDSTAVQDTTVSPPWRIKCSNIKLVNTKFSYRAYRPDTVEHGINFDDINISGLNLFARNFNIINDTIKLRIDSLSLNEKSGFDIDRLAGNALICSRKIAIDSLVLRTPHVTDLVSNRFEFAYNTYSDFSDFTSKIKMQVDFRLDSKFCFTDLSYFVPEFRYINRVVKVSGNVTGTVDNMKTRNLLIKYGHSTRLLCDFDIIGLPEIDSTHFDFYIYHLTTDNADIATIKNPADSSKLLVKLPEALKEMGSTTFQGQISGSFKKFVSDGEIHSNLGNITNKVIVSRDEKFNSTVIKGEIGAQNLEIGKLVSDQKTFGKLTFKNTVNVVISGKNVDGYIVGKIDSFYVKNYNYQAIDITGQFSEKKFDGLVTIADNNINANFNGKINFETEKPSFDFQFEVFNANLSKLNFDKAEAKSRIGFALSVKTTGLTPDDFNGDIKLKKPLIIKRYDKSFTLKKLTISSKIESYFAGSENKSISLASDFVNFSARGIFDFGKISTDLDSFIVKYFPSQREVKQATKDDLKKSIKKDLKKNEHTGIALKNPTPSNRFNFQISFNKFKTVTDFLAPDILIHDSTKINGNFNSGNLSFNLSGTSKLIGIGAVKINNFFIEGHSQASDFVIKSEIKKINFSENSWLENLQINSKTHSDSSSFSVFWNNNKTVESYFGDVKGMFLVSKNNKLQNRYLLDVEPSKIQISDTLWHLFETKLEFDTTAIHINNILFANERQSISANGTISEAPNDTLSVNFKNFNLGNLNKITGEDLVLSGVINGTTKLCRLYETPLFFTNDSITSLKINNFGLGNLYINSWYDTTFSKIKFNLFTLVGQQFKAKDISISGEYDPKNGKVDLLANIFRFKLLALKPLYKDILDLNRWADLSGTIHVKGKLDEPKVDAELKVTGAVLFIKYIETQYDLSDSLGISISNNNIQIHRTKLYSDKGSGIAFLSGNIKHNNFSKFNLNLAIAAYNFQCLNTVETDTSFFYGTAYATGEINIKGPPEYLVFDIAAKTNKRTRFFLPLSYSSEVSNENKFINFISKDSVSQSNRNNYKVDLSGIKLNFDLEVTPDAEVQLIMDKKIGDIIKARGNANLKMEITTAGDFNMYGNYNITKGDYLFTLKNVISKKFDIKKGSTIKWNGDPLDASIDINAVYAIKKASLYDLTIEEDDRDVKIPVECNLKLMEKLMTPVIEFGLNLGSADERIVNQINNLDEDNLNKQVLSLLILNRFRPLPGLNPVNGNSNSVNVINTGELLSNQINHWLSQISDDVNIGINYQMADEQTSTALEVALSKNFFDDRVQVYGNFGVGGTAVDSKKNADARNNPNNIVGDFDIEVKINKKGNLKLKGFNKTNTDLNYSEYPYTQGVGIFYRKDYNSIFRKKKKPANSKK